MVELEIGHRLGSGGVEGASVICVVERRAARGGERRWRGGQLEMLENSRHAGRLGNKCDETHRVAVIGANQRKRLVDARDEESPKRGGTHRESGFGCRRHRPHDPVRVPALMREGGIDIAQPDVALAGGYTEVRRIAAEARETGKRVVPHGYKTHVTDAVNLNLLAQHWRHEPLEYCVDPSPLRSDLTRERFAIDGEGMVRVPTAPGLGVTLDEEVVARYRVA